MSAGGIAGPDSARAVIEKRCSKCGRPVTDGLRLGLNELELRILAALSRGVSDEAIAEEIERSPKTVSWHVQRIKSKLGVSSRIEAVVSAVRGGAI